MRNISTGIGIALLAGAIVAYPILDRVMSKADASATHAAAVVAAATAQNPPEPTIVTHNRPTRPSPRFAGLCFINHPSRLPHRVRRYGESQGTNGPMHPR